MGELVSQNDLVTLRRSDLVAAIEGALTDYFFDGVSPTLGQYAVDHIIGDICLRIQARARWSESIQEHQTNSCRDRRLP